MYLSCVLKVEGELLEDVRIPEDYTNSFKPIMKGGWNYKNEL